MNSTQTFDAIPSGSTHIPTMIVDPNLSLSETLASAHDAIGGVAVSTPDPKKDRNYYRAQITLRWNQAYKAIMAVCHLIVDARLNLEAEEWKAFVQEDCPFDYSVLQKFMNMASNPRLNDPANEQYLPNSWTANYEIMQMKESTFRIGIQKGTIHQGCTLADLRNLRAKLEPPKRKSGKAKPTDAASAAAAKPEEPKTASTKANIPEPEPEVEKAATKSSRKNSRLRVEQDVATAEPTTATTAAATSTVTAKPSAKGRIAIMLPKDVTEQHTDDLDHVIHLIEALVHNYDFMQGVSVEIEVAA